MDRVRFGRALGMGAREAAKALVRAADAAGSPNPDPRASAARRPATEAVQRAPTPQAGVLGRTVAQTAAQSARQALHAGASVRREGKRFGETVWGPFARLSGVLWLEVTGVFFSLFALTAAVEAWKRRADFRGPVSSQHHLWFALAMLAVFGYFTASSFIKASRRSRG